MVLEVAVLNVREGQSAEFEEAFARAQHIIARRAGYERHELHKCLEHSCRYLPLVWWETLESHTVGFRESAEYQEWKALLHRAPRSRGSSAPSRW